MVENCLFFFVFLEISKGNNIEILNYLVFFKLKWGLNSIKGRFFPKLFSKIIFQKYLLIFVFFEENTMFTSFC